MTIVAALAGAASLAGALTGLSAVAAGYFILICALAINGVRENAENATRVNNFKKSAFNFLLLGCLLLFQCVH